jgi:flavin-dependent dehydrogenase
VAVFRHYGGLDERYNPGCEGDIQVGGHDDGWLWAIPIWPDTISIGAVMPAAVLRAFPNAEAALETHLGRVPRITQRLTGTTPQPDVHVESDYCYYSDAVTGAGWLLVGDAAHFIDPIFSGGTFLALCSGLQGAKTVDRLLNEPRRADELLLSYANLYKTGYDSYTRLISAYYESGYKLGAYFAAKGFAIDGNPWFARILSGDFWTDLNPFTRWLREQDRWDTFEPFDLVTECPVYRELDARERQQMHLGAVA